MKESLLPYRLGLFAPRLVAGPDQDGDKGGDGPERGVATKVRPKTKKPSMYRVILMNDDYTPMEFVVTILMSIFNKTQEEATQIMLNVHQNGVGKGKFMASFSPVLEETIHRALTYASDRKHELATLEHLLLALIEDRDAGAVMTACDIDLQALKADVTAYLDDDLSSLVVEDFEEARPTAGFHRVIQRAVIHVQSSGREEVTGFPNPAIKACRKPRKARTGKDSPVKRPSKKIRLKNIPSI